MTGEQAYATTGGKLLEPFKYQKHLLCPQPPNLQPVNMGQHDQ